MIFQYPGSPHSYIANALLWIVLIIAAVYAFFLLVEYINTKEIHHLLWAMSFVVIFILYHMVANTSTFGVFDDSLSAGFTIIIPGLIAAGILYAVWGKEKKLFGLFSVGGAYLFMTIVCFIIISVLSLANVQRAIIESASGDMAYFPKILTLGVNVANSAIIIGIPLYTTLKTKETTGKAYLMVAGGILNVIAMIFLALVWAELEAELLDYLLNTIVYFIAGSIVLFAFGMLIEDKWRFSIPGIEFEAR